MPPPGTFITQRQPDQPPTQGGWGGGNQQGHTRQAHQASHGDTNGYGPALQNGGPNQVAAGGLGGAQQQFNYRSGAQAGAASWENSGPNAGGWSTVGGTRGGRGNSNQHGDYHATGGTGADGDASQFGTYSQFGTRGAAAGASNSHAHQPVANGGAHASSTANANANGGGGVYNQTLDYEYGREPRGGRGCGRGGRGGGRGGSSIRDGGRGDYAGTDERELVNEVLTYISGFRKQPVPLYLLANGRGNPPLKGFRVQQVKEFCVRNCHRLAVAGSSVIALPDPNLPAIYEAAQQNRPYKPQPASQTPGPNTDPYYCAECDAACRNDFEFQSHMAGQKHRLQQYANVLNGVGESYADKRGVTVTTPAEITLQPGGRHTQTVTITNASSEEHTINCLYQLQYNDVIHIRDDNGILDFPMGLTWPATAPLPAPPPPTPLPLPSGAIVKFQIEAAPKHMGLSRVALLLRFEGNFAIARKVVYRCDIALPDAEMEREVAPSAPYVKPPPRNLMPPSLVVPGEAPIGSKGKFVRIPGKHPIPVEWRDVLGNGMAVIQPREAREFVKRKLGGPASDVKAMSQRLKYLMYLEELQQETDVRQFDIPKAVFEKSSGRDLILQVPGLAENRPSVLRGDPLYVRLAAYAPGSQEWEGYVHNVTKEEVYLRFDPKFHKIHVDGAIYHVRFSINRSALNFMQEALTLVGASFDLKPATIMPMETLQPSAEDAAATAPVTAGGGDGGWGTVAWGDDGGGSAMLGGSIRGGGGGGGSPDSTLLPLPSDADWGKVPPSINRRPAAHLPAITRWIKSPHLNKEQKEAVQYIVWGCHAPAPYIVFGPPGTGKTSVIIEAALQILALDPSSRLLLCAPSNSAADLLAMRLLEGGRPPSELLRLNAFQRNKEDLHPNLLKISPHTDNGFELPPAKELTGPNVRAIICTCLMAVKLYCQGIPAHHFTHLLIDEAGHAEEPLGWCPIAAATSAKVVLAGDPLQLGPIILSNIAKLYSLDISMLERLTNGHYGPYARHPVPGAPPGSIGVFNPIYITKLLQNYRSHPDILRLPSRIFYQSELLPKAGPELTHSFVGWDELPNPEFPMVFHAVVGEDEREGNSPSWFNVMEVKLVLRWVKELRGRRRNPVTDDDIGVITPYRKQVQRIRAVLRSNPRIKVGSVEEFQGQERKVIIISTVRSSSKHIDFDLKHRLGFVSNPKRFNVSITRAKALVIVIGNPEVLKGDDNWKDLMSYIQENRGCIGSAMPDLSDPDPFAADANAGADGLTAQMQGLTIHQTQATTSAQVTSAGSALPNGYHAPAAGVESATAATANGYGHYQPAAAPPLPPGQLRPTYRPPDVTGSGYFAQQQALLHEMNGSPPRGLGQTPPANPTSPSVPTVAVPVAWMQPRQDQHQQQPYMYQAGLGSMPLLPVPQPSFAGIGLHSLSSGQAVYSNGLATGSNGLLHSDGRAPELGEELFQQLDGTGDAFVVGVEGAAMPVWE